MASVSAEIKGDREALSQLLKTFSEKKYEKIKFHERKSSPLLKGTIELHGEMLFQHPAYLLKEIHRPHKERFELHNGELSFQRDGNRLRTINVQDHPVLNAFVIGYIAVLSGDLARLQEYYQIEFDQREYAWRLSLSPRINAMKEHVMKLEFLGDADTIRSILVYETGGDISTTYFQQ